MTVTPGADVSVVYSPKPTAPRTDTGTAFISGLSLKGSTTGTIAATDSCSSMSEWVAKYGARQTFNGPVYDAVETAFAEGVNRVYFSRQAGPAAVLGSVAIPATSSKFTARAKGPGDYSSTLYVGVASGVVTVYDGGTASANIVEVSPFLASVSDAQIWASTYSAYIDIVPIGTGALTDSAALALTGGADDRASVTATEKAAALARFGSSLGPGNVALPGDTLTASHLLIAQHCVALNWFGYCDTPDTATASTVTALGLAARAFGTDAARRIQVLDGWVVIPGVTASTTRVAPPSGLMLGLAARIDQAGNPNVAVANPNVISSTGIDVHYHRTDTERGALSDAGVTPIIVLDGQVGPFDDITPVDPNLNPEWLGAGANRFVMRVVADANAIAKAHMFAQNNGSVELGAFAGDLKGMLARWFSLGALFGDSTADAFRVSTADPVNTTATLQARQLKAAISLRVSPNSRQVQIQITNLPLTAAV
jgi:hypothetical protein